MPLERIFYWGWGVGCGVWGVGFGRELSVRPSVRLSSRGSTELAERPKSHAEVRTGVGKWGVGLGLGCGEVGKWRSGEIELKPQNPKTPKSLNPYLLSPVS